MYMLPRRGRGPLYVIYRANPVFSHARIWEGLKGVVDLKTFLTDILADL